jgi:hypothetical protein
VFVTEGAFSIPLFHADVLCTQEAKAANLGGSWKAWISDPLLSSGVVRVGTHGPWVRIDGQVVFAERAVSGRPLVAINRTAFGHELGRSTTTRVVFTGLGDDGASLPNDCSNWTSPGRFAYGDSTLIEGWSNAGSTYCHEKARLYCFEQ